MSLRRMIRNRRVIVAVALIPWTGVIAANGAALTGAIPYLPGNINTLAVGVCLAVTVLAAMVRLQTPVEAAFAHGQLHERQNADTQFVPALPAAVGDGIAAVVRISPGSGSGLHRRPSPRQRRG
jgi:hypothetical protein